MGLGRVNAPRLTTYVRIPAISQGTPATKPSTLSPAFYWCPYTGFSLAQSFIGSPPEYTTGWSLASGSVLGGFSLR